MITVKPLPSLQHFLKQLSADLAVVSDTPQHEAKLLLSHVLNVSHSYFYSHPEQQLLSTQLTVAQSLLSRRLQGEPLAYILGYWCFWSLQLEVSACTLIPRPDTEILVEQALQLSLPASARVLDLGTGTGAIALALASSRPDWQVLAVDLLPEAVALAARNAQRLGLQNCQVQQSSWFSRLGGQQFELIVSNPPYIEPDDAHLAALQFEPLSALVSTEQGLADIRHICQQAPAFLTANGWLWLEHGYNQAEQVRQCLTDAGFSLVGSMKDYGDNWRISGGCLLSGQ
ncbi:peptide chain release factor N(5)-glutamine methyltransferase [Arsukibacterium sp.]|uniref:peptide chain release factor N(5)-glutamine methyltransferase n=1 Tax=Arsukibacterium sp. TaxID=1977258 RepID=UPI002FD87F91